MLSVLKAGLEILMLFLLLLRLQHFVRGSLAVQFGVCVSDTDIHDAISSALDQKSLKQKVTTFIFAGALGSSRDSLGAHFDGGVFLACLGAWKDKYMIGFIAIELLKDMNATPLVKVAYAIEL
jgi:hypothetical protein